MIAGCSVSFFCDMSPCAQLTENPNIFLSLGVTPLSQAEKLRWSLTAIASHEHTGALLKTAPAPWLNGWHVNYWVVLTCPSTCWKGMEVSFGALLLLCSIYISTSSLLSPKSTHCAEMTGSWGVHFISHTLCQAAHLCGFWALWVGCDH